MLVLLSPAKTLDFESNTACSKFTRPQHLGQSRALIGLLKEKSVDDLQSLMSLSEPLAELNVERYRKWKAPAKLGPTARQAGYAFKGDVYQGLDFTSLNAKDRSFAQAHIRILSGLYGILRPLDLIAPHRLEMGTSLVNEQGRSLYAFWGETQTKSLNKELKADGSQTLVNLASDEYFKSVKAKKLEAEVIAPRFLDSNDGKTFKVMSFYAKRARGLMARWIVQGKVDTPEPLKDFSEDGYRYDKKESTPGQPVFKRSHA